MDDLLALLVPAGLGGGGFAAGTAVAVSRPVAGALLHHAYQQGAQGLGGFGVHHSDGLTGRITLQDFAVKAPAREKGGLHRIAAIGHGSQHPSDLYRGGGEPALAKREVGEFPGSGLRQCWERPGGRIDALRQLAPGPKAQPLGHPQQGLGTGTLAQLHEVGIAGKLHGLL